MWIIRYYDAALEIWGQLSSIRERSDSKCAKRLDSNLWTESVLVTKYFWSLRFGIDLYLDFLLLVLADDFGTRNTDYNGRLCGMVRDECSDGWWLLRLLDSWGRKESHYYLVLQTSTGFQLERIKEIVFVFCASKLNAFKGLIAQNFEFFLVVTVGG